MAPRLPGKMFLGLKADRSPIQFSEDFIYISKGESTDNYKYAKVDALRKGREVSSFMFNQKNETSLNYKKTYWGNSGVQLCPMTPMHSIVYPPGEVHFPLFTTYLVPLPSSFSPTPLPSGSHPVVSIYQSVSFVCMCVLFVSFCFMSHMWVKSVCYGVCPFPSDISF